ncbi:MAG: ankyrin repeat domain-containing protein [Deltaproteobacteria bacterium]|nr:ankyrin repeat domain-containing protein [Deltaproteobacteria bacterium]
MTENRTMPYFVKTAGNRLSRKLLRASPLVLLPAMLILLVSCAPPPLYKAAHRGDIKEVESLLAQKADMEDKNWALRTAAWEGHAEIVRILLDNGADVNAEDKTMGDSVLSNAVMKGHVDITRLLLDRGANANYRNHEMSVLHQAILLTPNPDPSIAGLLLDKGADVNSAIVRPEPFIGWTALHISAARGLADMARILLDRGADVNAKSASGVTPLHIAALNGREKVALILIDKGANTSAKDKRGATPLQYAETKGHSAIIDILKKAE